MESSTNASESLIIYTGGTFDLFHFGHVEFLRRCALFGKVIVALNTDDFVSRFKNNRTVLSFDERKIVLESCRYVDKVVENTHGEDSGPTIDEVNPDIIAIGSDWLNRDYLKQLGISEAWLVEREIGLLYLPYTKNISSTEIKRRLSLIYA